jgi:carbamoyltransferase
MPEVEDVFVFPHMGDGGLPLGAAMVAAAGAAERLHIDLTRLDLGPRYDSAAIEAALVEARLRIEPVECLAEVVASELALGKVVMWFQGGMEYGPRALGHRSVLARPDRPGLRDRLNLVLKRRVWYQPFCPSLLRSEAAHVLEDFDGERNWAMTMAYSVGPSYRTLLSGVMSVDGTCRPHIVADNDSSAFAQVLRGGRALWGIGAVLNTSFNIHGEPLVCSPADAVDVFLRSGADALAIGSFFVKRAS